MINKIIIKKFEKKSIYNYKFFFFLVLIRYNLYITYFIKDLFYKN